MSLQDDVARNYRVMLAERKLKHRHIYEQTGIARSTLIKLSKGESKGIQFETLENICKVLDVPVSKLFEQKKTDRLQAKSVI